MKCLKKCCYLIVLILPFYNVYALKPLVVGTLPFNPPFGEVVTNAKNGEEFVGYDIDLIKEICKRIQRECQFKKVKFHQLPEMLSAGIIDVGIGAIVITPQRKQKFLFSMPYQESHLQYVTLANAPFKTIDELKGKKIGVYLNAPAYFAAFEYFGPKVELISVKSSTNMLHILKEKEVDAILINRSLAQYLLDKNKSSYHFLGQEFPVGEGYGIIAKQGNDELISTINKAIVDMQKDGTHSKIYKSSPF